MSSVKLLNLENFLNKLMSLALINVLNAHSPQYWLKRPKTWFKMMNGSAHFFDDDYCRFSFVYCFRSTGELQVWVQEARQCPVVVDVDNKTPGVPGKGTVDISVDISILVINAL